MPEIKYSGFLTSVQNKRMAIEAGTTKDFENFESFVLPGSDYNRQGDNFVTKDKMQSDVLDMYNSMDFTDMDSLKLACKDKGLSVKVETVETEFVADKDETGTMRVYTFTDSKGRSVSITDANTDACLQSEEIEMNTMLSEIIDEIESPQAAATVGSTIGKGWFGGAEERIA